LGAKVSYALCRGRPALRNLPSVSGSGYNPQDYTTLKLEEACENGPSLTYTIVLGLV